MGVRGDHVMMCDRKGVIYKGRTDLDQWKSAHAAETDRRTLADAFEARTSSWVCRRRLVSQDMVKSMAKDPIVFAMANPDPEIG